MKRVIRLSLAFATYKDAELNSFAILVSVCLKTNLLFPNLPLTILALLALQTAFQNAITAAAAGGGSLTTAAKAEAREALIAALRQYAGYVTSLIPTLTESQILSSGFDIVSTNRTPVPLTQPVFSLDNSLSQRLGVNLQAVANAKAYHVQFSIGLGSTAWVDLGIFPNTKGIALTNLTSGTYYNVRIRAIGGSTQYSEWSTTMTMICT